MKINRKIMIFTSMVLATAIALPLVAIKGPSRLEVRDTFIDGNSSSEKLVKRANDSIEYEAKGEISDVKVQITDESNGKRNIRFVVGIDSANYTEAGFIITARGNTITKPISRVYLGIQSRDDILSPEDIFETNKYNYFLAYALIGVPIADYSSSINAKAYIKNPELSLDVLSNEMDTSIQEIIDIENPPIKTEALVLTAFSGWNIFYIKFTWTNSLNYDDLLTENIKVNVEYNGKTYQGAVHAKDSDKGVQITLGATKFSADGGNTATAYMKINVEITYNNTVYSASFYAKNSAFYTITTCRNEALTELNQYIVSQDYIKSKYEEINWQEFLNRKETAISNINAALTFADVAQALSNAKISLDEVEQRQLNLDVLKEVAISRLDEEIALLKQNWYTVENWTLINSIGRQEIENAASEEEIDTLLVQAKLNIASIAKNYNVTLIVDLLESNAGSGLAISISNLAYSKMSTPYVINCTATLPNGNIYISQNNDGTSTYNNGNGTRIIPNQFKLNGTGGNLDRAVSYKIDLTIEDNQNYLYHTVFDVVSGVYNPSLWRTTAKANIKDYFQANTIISSLYTSDNWDIITQARDKAEAEINASFAKLEIEDIANKLFNLIANIEKIDAGLDGDKLIASTNLNNFFNSIISFHYTTPNWNNIVAYKNDALVEIDDAETIEDIDNAYNNAVVAIKAVPRTYKEMTITGSSKSNTVNLTIKIGNIPYTPNVGGTSSTANANVMQMRCVITQGSNIWTATAWQSAGTDGAGCKFNTNGFTRLNSSMPNLDGPTLTSLDYVVELWIETSTLAANTAPQTLYYVKYQVVAGQYSETITNGMNVIPINDVFKGKLIAPTDL